MLLGTGKLSPLTDHTSGTFLVSKHKSTLAPVPPLVLNFNSFPSTNWSQSKTITKTCSKTLAPAADKTQAQPNSVTPILRQSHSLQHQFRCPVLLLMSDRLQLLAEFTEKVENMGWFGASHSPISAKANCNTTSHIHGHHSST